MKTIKTEQEISVTLQVIQEKLFATFPLEHPMPNHQHKLLQEWLQLMKDLEAVRLKKEN